MVLVAPVVLLSQAPDVSYAYVEPFAGAGGLNPNVGAATR